MFRLDAYVKHEEAACEVARRAQDTVHSVCTGHSACTLCTMGYRAAVAELVSFCTAQAVRGLHQVNACKGWDIVLAAT